ncbi:hypothetical protein JVT61DRAFT_2821 [Boletus reticuloceps]|uniref:Chitin synthase n=1 Tax=Boletus reticuloceps TaxID=495285 RepID=A0A8I3AA63_9AGAM|nr:hypothetical protein JVT61DRAFT_2821 [Boletus reticuloceps]
MESVFGYIMVLPGAFSAYRYKTLRNDDKRGEGPLQKYFLGETLILCLELVSKREGSWILHYVKSASAVTDVTDRVPELISQRPSRRWLNGSFFAAVHSIVHFHDIYILSSASFGSTSKPDVLLGNYYIAFVIVTNVLEDYLSIFHWPNLVLNYFYLGLLIMSFLGNRPQGAKWAYTLDLLGFALIMVYMTVSVFLLAYEGIENVAYSQGGTIRIEDFLTNAIF